MTPSVLIICDDQPNLDTLRRGLLGSGYKNVQAIRSSDELHNLLESGKKYDASVIFFGDDCKKGLEELSSFRQACSLSECLVVTAMNDAELAVECLRRGASDYLTMPISKEQLASVLTAVLKYKVPVNGRPRILIMEDDPVSAKLMNLFLSPYGDCTLVADGRVAVESFEKAISSGEIYHLLILDIMVPEIHGRDVLRRIREIEREHGVPGDRRARAIMTTALSDTVNVVESFKGQCDAYLVKPIDKKLLVREIAELGFKMEITPPA